MIYVHYCTDRAHLFVEQTQTGAMMAMPLCLWLDEANMVLGDILDEGRIPSGLIRENDPPPFHALRTLSARLHARLRNNESAQHLLGSESRETSEKYRDTKGSEWDIISS